MFLLYPHNEHPPQKDLIISSFLFSHRIFWAP